MRTVWFFHRSEERLLRDRGGRGGAVCCGDGVFEATATAGVALGSWAGAIAERLRGDERSGIDLGGSCLDMFVVAKLLAVFVVALSFGSKLLLAKEDVCRWQYSFPLQATAA